MGSRSFAARDEVEAILDRLPDGRNKNYARRWKSKSQFINSAIMHYHRVSLEGESCETAHLRIKYLESEIERLELTLEIESRRWWHWTR